MNEVILVNEQDEVVGSMEKMQAHELGVLHRAFSIFLFNTAGEMLLQKRADTKYHSGGKWTNACCSHPKPNEDLTAATARRLNEELLLNNIELSPLFSFVYKADFDNGLIEHEYDHVFTGIYNNLPELNPEEASDCRFISLTDLLAEIELAPNDFTPWFKIALPELLKKMG